MKINWKSPITWSLLSILIVFAIFMLSFGYTQIDIVCDIEPDGTKHMNYGKLVLYSLLFAIIVGIIVMLFFPRKKKNIKYIPEILG